MKQLNKSIQNFGIFFLILTSTLSCNSQNKNKLGLGDILKKCEKITSTKCKQAFFDDFPNSFSQFQELYGYDDVKGEALYYSNSEEHLIFFFKTSDVVKKETFIKKLIGISKEGKWDADSVNSFQSKLRKYFFANTSLFIKLLKNKNEKEIKGFWYFFTDEPHFNSEISNKVLKSLETEAKMRSAYLSIVKKVKKDNVH